MDKQKLNYWTGLLLGLAMTALPFTAQAAGDTPLSLSTTPLFLVNQVKPSVMVMLDNSGSMKVNMYPGGFDVNVVYYGMFNSAQNYEYDNAVPVDATAYDGSVGSAYNVAVDTTATGAFKESACTTFGSGVNCWSGNYLNWVTTRRIDATRMVLVGGKVEKRAGMSYGGSTVYKIVGNNERSDGGLSKASSVSSQFSPIADNAMVNVDSPANAGTVKALYQPYGKITTAGGSEGFIYDSSGAVIGEFGSAVATTSVDGSKNLLPQSWALVTYKNTYTSPIIIAKPPTRNGADPGVVRIRKLSGTAFEIAFQEWDYRDGNHIEETLPYMVIEEGRYTMPGGGQLEADHVDTDRLKQGFCAGSNNDETTVSFSSAFTTTPVVISSTVTFNDSDAVDSRIRNIGTGNFRLSLTEQENSDGSHAIETVDYIALEQMRIDDAATPFYLEAGTQGGVNDGNDTITFGASFPGVPAFFAGSQTIAGIDPFSLRTRSISNGSADISLDEEKSCDNEIGHVNETIGYIAVAGEGGTDYNVAVIVPSIQQGVLQQVQNDVRMGISFYRYNPGRSDIYNGNTIPGGTINFKIPLNPFVRQASTDGYRDLSGYVGSPIAEVIDSIEHYPLVWGTTPLAENLWEVYQYFEQDSPAYTAVTAGFEDFDLADGSNPERDPYYDPTYGRKMECANSNVLIFTDGEPYKDADVPDFLLDYDGGGNEATDTSDCTIGGAQRDTDCTDTDPNAWGHNNLDDVAYWGFCDKTNTAVNPLGSCLNGAIAENPSRDLRSDLTGDQYIRIDTVGFAGATPRQILVDTANNAGGNSYAAADGLALASTLVSVFADLASGSAASVAVTSGSLQSNSKLFLARFNSSDWSGDILAFAINLDGSLENSIDGNGLMQPGANGWTASTLIPAEASRVIFSHNGLSGNSQAGVPFQWVNLSGPQQVLLGNDIRILEWLRGDQSEEAATTGSTLNLRNRTATVLGDIVHSAPAFVGPPAFQYPDDIEGTTSALRYSTFKAAKLSRPAMIYAGSNDGMMHAFDAGSGVEKFAYVPNAVYSSLPALTAPGYVHQYTVDGSPVVVDAYFGNAWHTVLAAGLRGGGQAIYALDVTDPNLITTESSAVTNNVVLWEFTDADDADLGYTYSEPNIVKLQNGTWAAIFGNGYNNTAADGSVSTTGNAVLYIVNLETGALIKKIDTGVGYSNSASGGRPNGLATVAPTDIDGDSIVDYVYGGDLYGNMWKFDLTNASSTNWVVSNGVPMFTACDGATCTDTNRQPIVVRPQVSENPTEGGYMVYFGTGQYIEDGDNNVVNELTQSFYGIWDENLTPPAFNAFDKGDLKERKILIEVASGNFDVRITSGVVDDVSDGGGNISWPTEKGWYMDLILDGTSDNLGERAPFNPVFRQGRIIFTTLLPSTDACASGGSGWIMELDAFKGTRLDVSPFDINDDGVFTNADNGLVDWDINGDGNIDSGDTAPPSGVKTDSIPFSPGISGDKENTKEYKYVAGSSGNVEVITERPEPNASGRQSWRQIR